MEGGRVRRRVRVYDCRSANEQHVTDKLLETSGLDFNGFLLLLHREFGIGSSESFVLTTTDRAVLDFDRFEELQDDSTLHLLRQEHQVLPTATEERITFEPHYNTLIQGGMYEYYASEGQKSLPFALAELIDNSLSATATNPGPRSIEIRMVFDDSLGKPAVIVLDNGRGMSSKQLNNWAVYRRSKFSRGVGRNQDGYVRPDPVPRSLNSDISYFGVGGKQAVFYIGDSTRMISKPVGSPDVHELVLSKEDFETKERNREEIYSTTIKNRKPGDSSHVNKAEERFLHSLIGEESGKESFTAVVVTGVVPEHVAFLKQDFEVWTRQLAHIYHYYIHGVNGQDTRSSSGNSHRPSNIDIQITLREKPPKCPRVINLREVDNDMQTLFISSAVDTFEFKASTLRDGGTVEGLIRYHPFLYDRETYPKDPNADQASVDDDDGDNESGVQHRGRGEKPIFHCFWNGRLIPYTTLAEFDWCSPSKGQELTECYGRVSGVLFTDDRFQVSTNKLTYMELELKLKQKDTVFTRVVNGQSQRTDMKTEFTKWLKKCHETWDKQIQFLDYKGTIERTDVPVRNQYPWATFSSIQWDGHTYRTGQLVKTHRTKPTHYGSVVRFLLFGSHAGDVYATGGLVEVALEPKAFHDKIKILPISKIDKMAAEDAIQRNIDSDAAKLPEILMVDWPEGNPWPQNAVRPAGTPLGPFTVRILNQNRDSISKMPAAGQGAGKKLVMKLQVVRHGPRRHEEVVSCPPAQHSAKWGYWFKRIENLSELGRYTLTLSTVINESDATSFGGRDLPKFTLDFTIREGSAAMFVVGDVSPSLRVGVPFDIPLLIRDGFDHPATCPPGLSPQLRSSGLDVSYETVNHSGTTFTIRGVKVRGKVLNYQQRSKTFDLEVTLPGLKKDTQTIKISLCPGPPHSLHVTPDDEPITVENGQPVSFTVEVHDEAGNITAQPKQVVSCQVRGFEPVKMDCSPTGSGQLVTRPVHVKIIDAKPEDLKVQFEMPSQKKMPLVLRTLKVMPSTRVAHMEVYSEEDKDLVLRNHQRIECLAGGLLEKLVYKLYDEAGREVPPSAAVASRIKVNWTADVNLVDLVQGKLPDIQVPTQVQEARFYQVSYQDQSVSVSFSIAPRPGEPARLKATLPQSSVKLGEVLPGDISLELVDQYDNTTKALTPTAEKDMTVKAEGLDPSSTITFRWQESSSCVLVTGVRFRSGTPGSRELCFTYSSYVERVRVTVTAGVPAGLRLVGGPGEALQVLNDHGIAGPFLIQLCDEWGNPSPDQRVVVHLKSSAPKLKVKAAVTSQPVDAEGKASFTVHSVSGPKGNYRLQFKGSLNDRPIPGPSVSLTVIPDPNKPVRLSVDYDSNARLPAGGVLPVFSVTVVSDEGSPITTFNPADASMWLWTGVPSGNRPPHTATELKCTKPTENENNDRLHFRDKEIPDHVGQYTIQFSLRIHRTDCLYSDQITITVVANQPVKLGPDSQPPSPVVFYSEALSSRTLVEDLTLSITDSYGNPTDQDLNGDLVISMKNFRGEDDKPVPLFEGRTSSLKMRLVKGKVHIPSLAIMANSPGENASAYVLVFQPDGLMVPSPLAAFELLFHFYNDAENQQKMSRLSRRKDELTAAVAALRDILTGYDELTDLLTSRHQDAGRKEAAVRAELINRNLETGQTIPDIDRLLGQKEAEAQTVLRAPRRLFSVPDPFRGQQDVLGMVGHLAFIQDDDAARVISWSLRGDMNMVITMTTAAARRIFDDTEGRQSVLPLDSVYVPQQSRLLPHMRPGCRLFDPPGNPVFARDLLLHRQDPESCRIVFQNLLGNTILMDDLDSATSYRAEVVRSRSPCPTILTRQGDRISSRGDFGGAQNRVPPVNTLPVFGAPPPQQYHVLRGHLDLLRRYRSTLEKKDQTAEDLQTHSRKSPDLRDKQRDLEDKQKQLEDIERQLVSTPVRPEKRRPEDTGETSSIIPKRAKQSSEGH